MKIVPINLEIFPFLFVFVFVAHTIRLDRLSPSKRADTIVAHLQKREEENFIDNCQLPQILAHTMGGISNGPVVIYILKAFTGKSAVIGS